MQVEIPAYDIAESQMATLPFIELAFGLNEPRIDSIISTTIWHLRPLPCVTLVINMAQKANSPVKRKRALQLLQIVQLYRK